MPGAVRTELSYDPRGFLHAVVTNDGPALTDAVLDLLVPAGSATWIARVDEEGQPAMEDGEFAIDPDEPVDGEPSLHWHETDLAIPAGTTLLRFFIGVTAAQAQRPVILRIAR